jgi:hypothetical protein
MVLEQKNKFLERQKKLPPMNISVAAIWLGRLGYPKQ